MILNVVERAFRLRYAGSTDFEKRPHNVVGYANEDGAEVALYFDEKTNLLSKFETLGTVSTMDELGKAVADMTRTAN